MEKKNIALVAGGDSGEYVISVESARMIRKNLDPDLFSVYLIFIRGIEWVHVDDEENAWPVDKNDFSISPGGKVVQFDGVFITIHGTPGEDGKLQGYFDLLKIPYTTAGLLPSAITFNKYYCNALVAQFGIPVAKSVKVGQKFSTPEILQGIVLPVFVKPNKGGSSLGTTFVKEPSELEQAVRLALEHDDEVLVEEYIEGIELTCGAFSFEGNVRILPVTEIVSKTSARFFDFEAKYTPGAADEITPARIPADVTDLVQERTRQLYHQLGMQGLCRMDFIYDGTLLYFLEVNVTPGMSATSIVPQQAEVAGISIRDLFTMIVQDALTRSGR